MKKRNIICHTKKGRLSKDEKSNIADWHATMDIKDMAIRLNRGEIQVKKYLDEYLANAPRLVSKRSETEELRRELHANVFWSDIRRQFTGSQLVFYENSYIEYRRQFKEMTATELKQLDQLITIEIYMQIYNIEKRKTQEEIVRIDSLLRKEYEKGVNITSDERTFIMHNENMVAGLKANSEKKIKEYTELAGKHQGLLSSLKATRDQRMKNVDHEGRFLGVLKSLELSSRRKTVGDIMGIMDIATERERVRLATQHVFKDGMIDQPLLNAETVITYDEEK